MLVIILVFSHLVSVLLSDCAVRTDGALKDIDLGFRAPPLSLYNKTSATKKTLRHLRHFALLMVPRLTSVYCFRIAVYFISTSGQHVLFSFLFRLLCVFSSTQKELRLVKEAMRCVYIFYHLSPKELGPHNKCQV